MTSRTHHEPSPTAEPTPDTVTSALWGWVRLFTGAAAQIYLLLLATLTAIALVPALFGWQSTIIETGSMEPHVDPGDVVVLADLPDDQPVPLGGVVQFISPAEARPDGRERPILHRIVIAHEDGTYATAGDANADVDSAPLVREQITGQARLLVPLIGLPALWLGTGGHLSLGLWAAGTAAALLFTLVVFVPRSRDDDDERESTETGGDTAELPVLARRGALAVAGIAVLAGLTAWPVPPSTAAFTARTGTRASWSVAALPQIILGRVSSFAVLARTAVNEGTAAGWFFSLNGDLGTSPTGSINGVGSGEYSGTLHRNNATSAGAMTDATTLAAALDARPATVHRAATLTGTLTPGVYTSPTGAFTVGSLVLDAQGDPSARFVFRARTITVSNGATVQMRGTGRAANVYWRATDAIAIGTGSVATVGTHLAQNRIASNLGTEWSIFSRNTVTGRLISLGGSVDLVRTTVNPAG
ncbi:ice-binding family protein [Kocuria sp. NPDC057446]|uniref:ice-binding family protein n=1 Tax=Kocuria sp. NPDC057446 TaxID=3346137 RepID=UPI0036B837D4